MNRRDFLLSAAAATVAGSFPRAGGARPRRLRSSLGPVELQELLDSSARALGIVGAQMALYQDGQVHEFATGLAVRERNLPVTRDTLFQIGSTTKLFNAALIMSMVDDGTLDLDEPVKTWITDFRLHDLDATERVTLRQLLSMSSGIDNGPYTDHGRGDDALARYVAELAAIPQIFPPGTAFGYANAGSNVAGLAAQRAAGKNWETLLAERVLEPLGLEHAANFPEDLLFHSVALGYAHVPDTPNPVRVPFWGLPRSMAPAGGTLCSSAGDLVRFAGMFLRGGTSEGGGPVISEAAVQTMHTPQVTLPNRILAQKWCAGPYWKEWDGQVICGHSGTNSGGSSMLLWCPARGVAAATIANVARQGYPLADRVFDTVFPEVFGIEKPRLPTPDTVTPVDVDLRRYIGRFEAWGSAFTFSDEGGLLVASSGSPSGMSSGLIPLGDDRFLPVDPAIGGNRGWDVAFWGDDGSGRATHYLNGVFALRRTG